MKRLPLILALLVGSAWAQTVQQYVQVCTFVSVSAACKYVPLSTIQVPGPKGAPGTPGIDGKDGTAATMAVGTVVTGAPGSPAIVVNVGTPNAAVLNFAIPKGDTGGQGPPGPPTPYPGVTSDSANGIVVAGKVTASQVQTNGPSPNGLSVGGTAGANCTNITPSKPTCRLTIVGGVTTTCTGC